MRARKKRVTTKKKIVKKKKPRNGKQNQSLSKERKNPKKRKINPKMKLILLNAVVSVFPIQNPFCYFLASIYASARSVHHE